MFLPPVGPGAAFAAAALARMAMSHVRRGRRLLSYERGAAKKTKKRVVLRPGGAAKNWEI